MAVVVAISSKDVAEMLGKRHDNFLRDIRKYINTLGEDASRYFTESLYKDGLGKERFCYNITEAGCDLLAGRIIGEKSTAFREQYSSIFTESSVDPATEDLTVEDVAKRLGCTERNVYRLIKAGKLRSIQKEIYVPTTKTFVTAEALSEHLAEKGLVE